jgi:pimeloyl-ACP methyl ester carboxylesterase
MKNTLTSLILILSFSLLLQSCGGGDTEKQEPLPDTATFKPGTHPRFDPIVSDLPFNTDLIFARAATTDGTADVGTPTNPVTAALNQLDGFSTSAYFDILISGSVDSATVTNSSVFLLQLNTGTGDALNPASIVANNPFIGPATYSVGVVSLDGGSNNVIRVRPTLPLKSKAKYLVFITNDVKDTLGRALTASWSYNAIRDPNYDTISSLLPVRTAIQGWENLAGGFLAAVSSGTLTAAAAKQKIVLSYTFTTTDPQTPLVAMASPRAAIATAQLGEIGKTVDSAEQDQVAAAVGVASMLDGYDLLPSPKARELGISGSTGVDFNSFSSSLAVNIGKLYTGYIKLPYYLASPVGLSSGEYLTRVWKPDLTLAAAMGKTIPRDLDASYNLTYRYPFAAKTGDESVPLQVTMPEDSTVSGLFGTATCAQYFGADGYPVVIYVHGITSDRSSIIALGHTLAARCVATVAIDLPLHGISAYAAGAQNNKNPLVNVLNVERSQIPFADLYDGNAPHERHFNLAGAGGAPAVMNFDNPTANDGSGAQFVNLTYFANTRDNLRQSVVDLLNLNASLADLDNALKTFRTVGINRSRVYVVGMSLGGIVSTNFVTANQLALASEGKLSAKSNMDITPVLNPVRGMILSASGTQVSQIMLNSPRFAPTIKAGLAAAGVNEGTSNYERFVYAIQSMVDSGDPVNFAQTLGNLSVPLLLQQINNDQVISNSVAGVPLTGNEAMARLLGLTQIGLGSTDLGKGHVKMNAGVHSSLLSPDPSAPLVTAELQAQVVSFVVDDSNVGVGSRAPANVVTP